MADRDRIRRDDLDDDEIQRQPSSSSDNTGTIIATIFGVWFAAVGAIGLVYVLIVLCFFAVIFIFFCVFISIMLTVASNVPRQAPQPAVTQPNKPAVPNNPPAETEKPKPKRINPAWKDDDLTLKYLSDLPEIEAKVGFGKFGKKGQLGYSIRAGEVDSPITFMGDRSPEALSTAPSAVQPASVKYRLNGQYKLFKASVACNDLDKGELGSRQPMTFKVYGDGVLLWVSEPVQAINRKQDVRLSVEGVDVLELQVHCKDGTNARAIWLEAQVLK